MILLRSFHESLIRKIFRIRNFFLEKYFVKKLDYKRSDLKIRIDSSLEYFVRANSCAKEPETVKWIEKCAEKKGVLYDVGANVGAYSLVSAKCGLQTIAFEPSFRNFNQLNRNIKINRLEKLIIPINAALSSNVKLATFNFLDNETGSSKCYFNESGEFHYQSPVTFTSRILVLSLDNFVENFTAPFPNYLKIDVDGAELDVMRGATNIMKKKELLSIQVEIDNKMEGSSQVINMITTAGFELDSKIDFKNNISNYIFYRI